MRDPSVAFVVLVCVAQAWIAGGCRGGDGSPEPASPPARWSIAGAACDEATLSWIDDHIRHDGRTRASDVASGLAEACSGFSPVLREALRSAGPDILVPAARAASGLPAAWARACRGGHAALIGAERPALLDPDWGPRERARAFWDGCAIEALGIATLDEWLRAKNIVLALITYGAMVEVRLSPRRVRAYTRALAELDAPEPAMLAQRYPSDGLRPDPASVHAGPVAAIGSGLPRRGTAGGAVPPRPAGQAVVARSVLDSYEGHETVARAHADAIARTGQLGGCLAAFPAPQGLAVKLTIGDGEARDGDVIVVDHIGPNRTVHHPVVDHAELTRCLLARAARVTFPPYAATSTIVIVLN